jgi:hypothetical protein
LACIMSGDGHAHSRPAIRRAVAPPIARVRCGRHHHARRRHRRQLRDFQRCRSPPASAAPYRDANRVAFIHETRAVTGLPGSVSPLNYRDWRNQSDAFDAMAAVTFGASTMTAEDTTTPVRGQRVSAHYFRVFGLTPLLGRDFVAGDDAPGGAKRSTLVNDARDRHPQSAGRDRRQPAVARRAQPPHRCLSPDPPDRPRRSE